MEDKDIDTEPKPESTKGYGKKYGKRSVWWWVALYVIVAVVLYGVIYLVFFNHSGNSVVPVY